MREVGRGVVTADWVDVGEPERQPCGCRYQRQDPEPLVAGARPRWVQLEVCLEHLLVGGAA